MELPEVHISSFIVHARPEHLTDLKRGIEAFPGAEIRAQSDCGKLVVVLESSTQNHITDTLEKIAALPQVLNTALVYHQVEAMES